MTVSLRARRQGWLRLTVHDDGPHPMRVVVAGDNALLRERQVLHLMAEGRRRPTTGGCSRS